MPHSIIDIKNENNSNSLHMACIIKLYIIFFCNECMKNYNQCTPLFWDRLENIRMHMVVIY